MSTPTATNGASSLNGLIPAELPVLTRKDFVSDQEVRWCPGCGDYSILAQMQKMLPELHVAKENIVFISGIGCSSRFPYYVETYGFHSIHGRALTLATGLKTARPELTVFVITGDGDGLSIGGNHLLHAMRRNVDLNVVLFNNRIYGLTKGQYSPTSEPGKVTKSTPLGSVDHPFNPVSLALGAEASFVARTIDSDRTHLTRVLRAAANHRGAKFIEIYQNCPIFNDGAFDALKGPQSEDAIIPLEHGEPIIFGHDKHLCVVRDRNTGGLTVALRSKVDETAIVVHDAHRPDASLAFALSRLTDAGQLHRSPIGIFRDVERPAYDDLVRGQVELEVTQRDPDLGLAELIAGSDTWTVD